MSNRSIPRRKLAVENLENRLPLAGNVSAQVAGGTLLLFGDRFDNSLAITGGDVAGQFLITGLPNASGPTTINGQTAIVVNGVRFSVIAHLREGNDTISVADADIASDLVITTDTGNDTVLLGNAPQETPGKEIVFPPVPARSLHVGGALVVNTGLGDDDVDELSVAVRFSNVIDTGPGNDAVFLGPGKLDSELPTSGITGVQAGIDLIVNLGAGDDFATATDLRVGGNLHIVDPLGTNQVSVNSAVVDRNVFVVMGSGRDIVSLTAVQSNLLHVNALGGDDDVTINAATTNRLEVFLGLGNDRLAIGTSRAAVDALFDGGPGQDLFVDLGGNLFARQRRFGFE